MAVIRKRKVRCSAEWPVCQFCTARKLECVYEGHPAENGGTMCVPRLNYRHCRTVLTRLFGAVSYAGPTGITPGANGSPLDAELPATDMILEALDAFITNQCATSRPSSRERRAH